MPLATSLTVEDLESKMLALGTMLSSPWTLAVVTSPTLAMLYLLTLTCEEKQKCFPFYQVAVEEVECRVPPKTIEQTRVHTMPCSVSW